jgi:hypothetical protein
MASKGEFGADYARRLMRFIRQAIDIEKEKLEINRFKGRQKTSNRLLFSVVFKPYLRLGLQ